ncbi:MAG TPA: arginine deiminase-related protein [Vicinamibacteria bacterium]|nr:arginine deiminase-related protein [Vicinamibacteria bacterium]
MRQAASGVLMIEPVGFRFSAETARTNRFMRAPEAAQNVQPLALKEFRGLVETLERASVEVLVRQDLPESETPDSIFPNNWVSFHEDGRVVLYPMEPPTRRRERRHDILDWLRDEKGFDLVEVVDLTHHEQVGRFLEGTGSMVLDRVNRIAYAGISARTTPALLEAFASRFAFSVVSFRTSDAEGDPIYHTNVLLSVGTRIAIVCGAAIPDLGERRAVFSSLESTGLEILDISMEQLHAFVGNTLELQDLEGEPLFALSDRALAALRPSQKKALERYGRLVASPIPVIEDSGGGSVRCMLAEVFLPRRAG